MISISKLWRLWKSWFLSQIGQFQFLKNIWRVSWRQKSTLIALHKSEIVFELRTFIKAERFQASRMAEHAFCEWNGYAFLWWQCYKVAVDMFALGYEWIYTISNSNHKLFNYWLVCKRVYYRESTEKQPNSSVNFQLIRFISTHMHKKLRESWAIRRYEFKNWVTLRSSHYLDITYYN